MATKRRIAITKVGVHTKVTIKDEYGIEKFHNYYSGNYTINSFPELRSVTVEGPNVNLCFYPNEIDGQPYDDDTTSETLADWMASEHFFSEALPPA